MARSDSSRESRRPAAKRSRGKTAAPRRPRKRRQGRLSRVLAIGAVVAALATKRQAAITLVASVLAVGVSFGSLVIEARNGAQAHDDAERSSRETAVALATVSNEILTAAWRLFNQGLNQIENIVVEEGGTVQIGCVQGAPPPNVETRRKGSVKKGSSEPKISRADEERRELDGETRSDGTVPDGMTEREADVESNGTGGMPAQPNGGRSAAPQSGQPEASVGKTER